MTTLTPHLTLGEPQVAGPLAVFPVLNGPDPQLEYRTFADAIALGALVKELDGGASVNDLVVANPTDKALLVYEGEEVLGAQQNRTFDSSVLVAVGGTVRVPVSCVEAGRWDGARHHEVFEASPQAADPELRRRKRMTANARAAAGREARADQHEVWSEVGDRLDAHGVDSPSQSMNDLFARRRDSLTQMADAVRHVDGQVGAVAYVGSRPAAVDLVSRPDAFASLLPRLAQGYALDALGAPNDPGRADSDGAERFFAAALHAPRETLPTPGLGRGVRLLGHEVVGSGLEHGGELIQLCAFAPDSQPVAGARIARPSRRRP